jgi:uroporphyrinogen-III synthase
MSAKAVLVTRPEGQAGRLRDALVLQGYAVHAQPLMELSALPELAAADQQYLQNLDQYQHVIFISGNAVHFGMERIVASWPQLPVGINWYAIGASTAQSLAAYGVVPLSPALEMTSEGLLALPTLQSVAEDKVLIVKGEGGRDTLREILEARGAQINELRCYRRICPSLGAGELAQKISDWQIGLILISSGEGLTNMLALLSPQETTNLQSVALLVPSRRIAREAEAMGFANIVLAENASDAAVMQAVDNWQSGSGES